LDTQVWVAAGGHDERSITGDQQDRRLKNARSFGTGFRPLKFASRISECHSRDLLEQPVDVVVVDDFHIEIEV
jgi:hypothetical protein